MNFLRRLRELKQYPSAILGLSIITLLIILGVITIIYIPYSEAISLWRGGEAMWADYPRNASPSWLNVFRSEKLSKTIIVDSEKGDGSKSFEMIADDIGQFEIVLPFKFNYDSFPKELNVFFNTKFERRAPYITALWRTPDGREITLESVTARSSYRISQDVRLQRRLGGLIPHVALFSDPGKDSLKPLKGEYELVIQGNTFEKDTDFDARLVVYGQVHGLAGTDHRRRDMMVALLWGTPIALAFGFLATVGTNIFTLIISATGVWYGKWVDASIQKITEVNMILPVLPILIMVGTFYSRSIWVMLVVIITLNIFSGAIKSFRAMLLQIKESPYIEAAKSYGASNFRIIFRYLIPRIIPTLIPNFVTGIPTFVFLEASLAVLGLGDPTLPTWGKMLNDALQQGALYNGYYYWVLQPAAFLMITGLGFAMLGFALDRIFNPRLRGL